jgi:ABC-type dipeptide/oligopeptide/nickel transport system ATPase subunit/uncharacterized protein (DUF2164 family)
MSECVNRIERYLEKLTDTRLKEKNSDKLPIVGESPLIKLIADVKKGNFVIDAHTGAGKTTLGLTLYHKAKHKEGELAAYDVIYINLREIPEKDEEFKQFSQEKILKILFDHESEEHKKVAACIYSTTKLQLKPQSQKTPLLYEYIKEYHQKMTEDTNKKRLIVVIDEFERAYKWDVIPKTLTEWFSATRKFYDETYALPLKLVILLPKILSLKKDIEETLKTANEAAFVFTEFKELKIDEGILNSYLNNLINKENIKIDSLQKKNGFKRLLKTLSKLQSGRYIFPTLWKAISTSICQNENEQITGDIKDFLSKINKIDFKDIDADAFLNELVIGITEGKPFRIYSKSEAIKIWDAGFHSLCKKLKQEKEAIKPLKIGYQDFVYSLNDNIFVWMTLEKNLKITTFKKIGYKVSEFIGAPVELLNIIVLAPEFTRGASVKDMKIEKIDESKRKRIIKLMFKYRILSTEELLSIATLGGLESFDQIIASQVIKELVNDINDLTK